MANKRLTKATTTALKPQGKEYFVWDEGAGAVPGFGIKVLPSGRQVAVLQYRVKGAGRKGTARRFTIGTLGPGLTFARAKVMADGLRAAKVNGGDPVHDTRAKAQADELARSVAKEEAQTAKKRTFNTLAEIWLRTKEEKRNKNGKVVRKSRRSLPQLRLLVSTHMKEFLPIEAAKITADDVKRVIGAIEDRAPFMAGQVLWAAKAIFNGGVALKWFLDNPAAGLTVDTGASPEGRERTLDSDELSAIWLAAKSDQSHLGKIIRLLILTAARVSEVAGMYWSEINLDTGVWTIPAARAKNKTKHLIHLSPQAIDILRGITGTGGGLVFSTTGTTPFSGISKAKARLDRASKVKDWRIHDIRRTVATGLSEMGFGLQVVERLLNHKGVSRSGLPGIYNKAEYLDDRKRALEAWGAKVEALVSGTALVPNVVPITTARR